MRGAIVPIQRDMWFMHDGASAHFSSTVRHFLNATYTALWIGHGGTVAWPPRSSDLNPLDFFFWGHMKSLVYQTPVDSAEDLVARIVVAADKINTTPGIFERVASHSFGVVNCETTRVAATLSTCWEFFSDQ
ncbi:hypothetical protein AVEN_89792-1 [Araneus ventricosus]|uniref:Tc1-like transposase DDE domain-containing protein n=1 Tax=Araneus ventricosus TaxID=182803 RepID=A0A4Y2I376_ARAVE|nr:hypothetical protein AVEN_89792-1 [Araneus ventricosus]